jgi:hypothetical protein
MRWPAPLVEVSMSNGRLAMGHPTADAGLVVASIARVCDPAEQTQISWAGANR